MFFKLKFPRPFFFLWGGVCGIDCYCKSFHGFSFVVVGMLRGGWILNEKTEDF